MFQSNFIIDILFMRLLVRKNNFFKKLPLSSKPNLMILNPTQPNLNTNSILNSNYSNPKSNPTDY